MITLDLSKNVKNYFTSNLFSGKYGLSLCTFLCKELPHSDQAFSPFVLFIKQRQYSSKFVLCSLNTFGSSVCDPILPVCRRKTRTAPFSTKKMIIWTFRSLLTHCCSHCCLLRPAGCHRARCHTRAPSFVWAETVYLSIF